MDKLNAPSSKPTPFLRWAGGKSKIVHLLSQFVPSESEYTSYIEPFLGSGALYFCLQPKYAILADVNIHLINCFQQVALQPQAVWLLLQTHLKKHSREYYYAIREIDLSEGTPLERAARFIFLNKTAFNGIFRVNRLGKFNVPFGPSTSGPAIPSEKHLVAASDALKNARLFAAPFEQTCQEALSGDFVYLDPPYPPLARSANFTHYTPDRFGMEDQNKVANIYKSLDRKGCKVMLSNSDQPQIRLLYPGYRITKLDVIRWLGSNGKRFHVDEIVVTNYDPPSHER
jgi:DNA adenine methylase